MALHKSLKNSKLVGAADAQPGTPWTGQWEKVMSAGYTKVVVVATTASVDFGPAGKFFLEFSPTESSARVSIDHHIASVSLPTSFDYPIIDEFFRLKYEPSSALGSKNIEVSTLLQAESGPVTATAISEEFLEGIFNQLKQVNMQLALITGVHLEKGDE